MKNWIIVLALAIAAALGAFFFFGNKDSAPVVEQASSTAYAWEFAAASSSDEAMPRTTVSIRAGGEVRAIGTYTGTCAEQKSDLLPNEDSKVVCWFAGGGNEIGYFIENGTHTVRVGEVDEGSAEEAGFRGNFNTVLTLE